MKGPVSTFVEAIPLPACAIRSDERIAAANAPARALLGDGIVGRHFITALRQPDLLDAIEGCLRDSAARSTLYLTNNGSHDMTYRVSVNPLTLDSGGGTLVSFEDITPLEQVGQMRRDFVANVSHELRTPLTALIGFIDTLKGPARDDPVGRERFLRIMETEALRMNRLVDDLLSLSRVEADERVRPTDPVDLANLILQTVDGLAPLARDAEVDLRSDLPSASFTIAGDQDQLRQVLSNLVENAIKYSGRGAQVCLRLSKPEYQPKLRTQGISLEIADTGPGIDQIHLPRLTERFYRIDAHRSREKGGTGLGLAIVKHIVNRHRGRLRVRSELGEGTVFTVILPQV